MICGRWAFTPAYRFSRYERIFLRLKNFLTCLASLGCKAPAVRGGNRGPSPFTSLVCESDQAEQVESAILSNGDTRSTRSVPSASGVAGIEYGQTPGTGGARSHRFPVPLCAVSVGDVAADGTGSLTVRSRP